MYQTQGRDVLIGAGNDPQFRRLCQELGRPDLASDPRFLTNRDRQTNRAALQAELKAIMAEVDGETLAVQLMRAGVPAGAALEVPDVLQHPHTRHRDMVVEMDGYRGTGTPIKMSRTKAPMRSKPPQFAIDTRAVLRENGFPETEIDALLAAGIVSEERRKL
jgi:formyl-CoA transferase